jgi:uncharacterized protein (TIGR02246 family)
MTSNATLTSDRAVHAVFEATSKAWATGNAAAFVEAYAPNATVVLPGMYLPNKDAIRAAMTGAFAGPLSGSHRIHEVQSIRYLNDHIAIVISNSATVLAGEASAPPERREWATWILAKQDEQWLIEAYHSSPQLAE